MSYDDEANEITVRSALIKMDHAMSLLETARGYMIERRELATHLVRQAADVLLKTVELLEKK